MLTLAIHPDDVHTDLSNSAIGTRYQVALVELADDGQPVAGPETTEADKALRVAAALCRDEKFWEWIAVKDGILVDNETEAAVWLRDTLGISSRTQIKEDARVRDAFFAVRDEFLEDYRRGRR